MIPYESIKKNKNILMVLTQGGGHSEWFTGNINPERWGYKVALEFLCH